MKPQKDQSKPAQADEKEAPQMPFDEALKRVWSAPPNHKAKPPAKKQQKKTG